MRIIVMGTGGFAVPTLERLLSSRHDVVAVVTMPLRNARGSKSVPTPVRAAALDAGLTLFDPENVNDPAFLPTLQNTNADLLFVCDYGKILAPHVIASAKHGGINLHGSLLPKYRGAAPINRALLNGEPTVGVSVIHITPELDAGPVVAMSEPLPVQPDDTAVEIETKLAQIGSDLVMAVLDQFEAGTLAPIPQRPELVCNAPKLKKHEGAIDWRRSAREIVWQYQAMQPWPKIFTDWQPQKTGGQDETSSRKPMRLILGRVQRVADDSALDLSLILPDATMPGTVVEASNGRIIVATGSGLLQIFELQPAGKKMMPANDFLRGYPLQSDDHFV